MKKYLISVIKFTPYLILIYISYLIFVFTDDNSHWFGWDFHFKFNRFWNYFMAPYGHYGNSFSEEITNKIRPILNSIAYLMLMIPIYIKIILPAYKIYSQNNNR